MTPDEAAPPPPEPDDTLLWDAAALILALRRHDTDGVKVLFDANPGGAGAGILAIEMVPMLLDELGWSDEQFREFCGRFAEYRGPFRRGEVPGDPGDG